MFHRSPGGAMLESESEIKTNDKALKHQVRESCGELHDMQ